MTFSELIHIGPSTQKRDHAGMIIVVFTHYDYLCCCQNKRVKALKKTEVRFFHSKLISR